MTKIKLLYQQDDYVNFAQGVIASLVRQHFDLVQYQPGETYNSADTMS